MSKTTPLYFAVQIRVYEQEWNREESLYTLEKPQERIIFKTENRQEAYQYFEDLKSKNNEVHRSIRNSFELKPFFEARILKYTPKEIESVGWTWILQRYIDISYRCKIIVKGKTFLSKKIYHVPPVLINSHNCPPRINSREARAFACNVLRSFLPMDSFELLKITASTSPIEYLEQPKR